MTTPLALQVARVLLMKGRPYLATAVWALQPVPVRDHLQLKGTLGVDKHWRLYFDPEILPTWSPEALAGALYHELHHLLRGHHQRATNLIGDFGEDELVNIEIASRLQLANIAEDCVAAGSRILMADGTERPIESVRPGQQIVGIAKGKLTTGVVRALVAKRRCGYGVELRYRNDILRSTFNHKVLTQGGYHELAQIVRAEKQSAQIFRIRESIRAGTLQNPHHSRNGNAHGTPFFERAVTHEERRLAAIAGLCEAAEQFCVPFAAAIGDGISGWIDRRRRYGVGGAALQHATRQNLLSAGRGHQQHEQSTRRLAQGSRHDDLALHQHRQNPVLENEHRRFGGWRSLPSGAAVLGGESRASETGFFVVRSTQQTASPHEADPTDVPDLSGTEALEYAACSAQRSRIETGEIYYDLATTCHSYVANGFAVHNCEINDDLEEEKIKLPPIDYATPAKYGLKNSDLWENYYHELLKQAKPITLVCIGGEHGCGSCANGKARSYELPKGDKDAPGISQAEAELVIRKTAADVQEHARSRGNVPASLKRWADNLLNPQVPWQRVLASAIKRSLAATAGATDYSFQRPNRRNSGDFILPGMVQPVPNVAVVGDTSGSMGESDLRMIVLTELKGICRALGQGTLTFLDVDAEVHGVQRVVSERQVQLRGGGGTDMRAGIDRACELRPKPSLVVILTDGETGWGSAPPAAKCLAVVPKGAPATPDWMRRVEIDL